MYILAVDTAFGKESCAISKNGEIIAFSQGTDNSLQAERLFEHINKLLAETKLSFEQIDHFAANLGPGSFTGIRIGLSAILGLSLAQNKKLIGVSSFEALAHKIWKKYKTDKISVALDAGRDQAYFQEFEIVKDLPKQTADGQLIDISKIIYSEIGNISESKIKAVPDAKDIALTAHDMLSHNIVNFNRKEPIYIRKSSVEEKFSNV
jgi:tRNA threonylcarbamoyl adenosine modification protein YeaZ